MEIIRTVVSGLVFGLSVFAVSAQTDHLGSWETFEDGAAGILTFEADGALYIDYDNEVIGGHDFELDGKKASMVYSVDYSQTPYQMDFILTVSEAGEKIRSVTRGIFRFNTDKTVITICMGVEGEERPTEFDPEDTMDFTKTDRH